MTMLFAKNLFDLSNFQHASLFASDRFVWDALKQLEGYIKTLELGKIEAEVHVGAYLIDKHLISIGKGSVVEPGAYIKGPCVIGNDCVVRQGAYIRGNLLTGNHCVVGHDSEIKNTIMLDRAHAPHFAYVGDSILGNRVNLGAGTILSNLRFDGKEVVIFFEGKSYATGLRKMGAILGDDSQTGCHTVTNPGVIFGKKASSFPTSLVSGVVPENSRIRSTTSSEIIPQ